MGFIKELFEDMPIIMGIFSLFVAFMLFLTVDFFGSTVVMYSGQVVDKHYKAEKNSTGTGVGMIGGKTGVIVTSNHESEEFLVMVEIGSGEIVTSKCPAKLYYEKEVGDPIEIRVLHGWFTDNAWSIRGVK